MIMSSRTGLHVAVVKGGRSAERQVSIVSGRECAAALRRVGYKVSEVDAGNDLPKELAKLSPDIIFNALHGRFGEDGCVQGLFEWLELPYTHSGVQASALAMDKFTAKKIFETENLPVAQSICTSSRQAFSTHLMEPPYVIKPVNEGSSVGVHLVMGNDDNLSTRGKNFPNQVLVEKFIPGRELTTTIMDEQPLGVTDIITNSWYDYKAKYNVGASKHIVPADIPKEVYDACEDFALRAHLALGCKGISRADFRWDNSLGIDGLFLLEINTQPGMTPTSLSPEQAQVKGISFDSLCNWIVEDASCNR
jgi:D-alanine-D-alanine ligase